MIFFKIFLDILRIGKCNQAKIATVKIYNSSFLLSEDPGFNICHTSRKPRLNIFFVNVFFFKFVFYVLADEGNKIHRRTMITVVMEPESILKTTENRPGSTDVR